MTLKSKFSSWYQNDSLDTFLLFIDLVQKRNQESSGFSCAILCTGDDTLSGHDEGNRLFLNGSGDKVATLGESQDDLFLELQLTEIFIFSCLDILDEETHTLVCYLTS